MKSIIAEKTMGRSININQYGKKTLVFAICLLALNISLGQQTAGTSQEETARATGLRYISVHVLELEKSLKLYREILGFKLDNAEVLHGPWLEGMLVMKLKANDLTIGLSVTAPEFMHTIGPIGNTNHNHFMLKVNDIKTIGDKLIAEGYQLENENYARDKYTFFVGPNGEIVGLSSYD